MTMVRRDETNRDDDLGHIGRLVGRRVVFLFFLLSYFSPFSSSFSSLFCSVGEQGITYSAAFYEEEKGLLYPITAHPFLVSSKSGLHWFAFVRVRRTGEMRDYG
jgi:hypothetical protein